MGHFEDLEDLGLKTSVSVLGIRPGPRSELKTLDRLILTNAMEVADLIHLLSSFNSWIDWLEHLDGLASLA